MSATKFCSKCQLTKFTYEFNHRSDTADGFQYKCKQCSVEQRKQWNDANINYVNEKKRNSYATNLQVKINNNMHGRLNRILRRGIYSSRTEQIIGLSHVQFLEWISFNFENEMS